MGARSEQERVKQKERKADRERDRNKGGLRIEKQTEIKGD